MTTQTIKYLYPGVLYLIVASIALIWLFLLCLIMTMDGNPCAPLVVFPAIFSVWAVVDSSKSLGESLDGCIDIEVIQERLQILRRRREEMEKISEI